MACERDERPLELARQAWHEAGVAHKVKPWRIALFCLCVPGNPFVSRCELGD